MTHQLVLYIKSFAPDLARVNNLLESIRKYNVDNLPVYISVNDKDHGYFKKHLTGEYTLLQDSEIVTCKIKDGWRYQQVVKAQFFRLRVCDFYLCLDSDSEFIRPFHRADFMYNETTPYTVMHEGKSFLDEMEMIGRDSSDLYQTRALLATRQVFGTHGKSWDYGPSPYLWSANVWADLIDGFIKNRGQHFEDFFIEMERTALPSEAILYGEYLLKTRLIDILPVEGFFKVYHYKEQFELDAGRFDLERLKKNYMGIIKQSNWNDDENLKSPKRSWLTGR